MSPPERRDRFPKRPAREEMIETERFERVEQNDVEIPRDAAVLKRVVQYDQLALQLLDGGTRGGHTVGQGAKIRSLPVAR